MRLGVACTWHTLSWEELLEVARCAEAQGYEALYHDGDVTMLSGRRGAEVLDGWTVTTALLMRTERIQIGSIRLVQHWNAAHLAQAAATAERIAPSRLRFFASIGDRPEDPRFGFVARPAAVRAAWLEETLGAVRALWRGEDVTVQGEHVQLEGARIHPTPPEGALPVEVGAKGPRMIEVVARHADVWNVNLPPVPRLVERAGGWLERACVAAQRDSARIDRRMWIFTRVAGLDDRDALSEFRRLNPWFGSVPDAEAREALVVGSPEVCRARLAAFSETCGLELPVLDLSGLDAGAVLRTLEALPAGDAR